MTEATETKVEVVTNGAGTAPVPVEKKKRKGGNRNKPKKPVWAKPSEKLTSHETPGFDVTSHARLKSVDFADPLDYAKWDVWYYEQRLHAAKRAVETMLSLGSTPEERKAAASEARIMQAYEALVARRKAQGGGKAAALAERLGKLFDELSNG